MKKMIILVLTIFVMLFLNGKIYASSSLTCQTLSGASVYSQESPPTYLGFFGNSYSSESIMNQFGTYGSRYSSHSVRNQFGTYGSRYSLYSANNKFTSHPPVIVKDGYLIGYLTTNNLISGGVSLSAIDASCSFVNSPSQDNPPNPKTNLMPYKPDGWSDKIVTSTMVGTNDDSISIYETDIIYIDWAVINDSDTDAGTFVTTIYVDGQQVKNWRTNDLTAHNFCYINDYPIGTLSAGTHSIKIVTDSTSIVAESDGTDNDYTKTIMVNRNPIISNFISNTENGIGPLRVQFTDSSTGDITSWSWNFGDGTTSSDQNPTHVYQQPGTYNVTLTVTGPGGTDTETKTGYIIVNVPPLDNCRSDNLEVCDQQGCEGLGAEYWWYDGLCRSGSLEVDYTGHISQAPVRLGDDANDGSITDGDGLSIIVDIPAGVRSYTLLGFPNDLGYYFIDSGSVITTQLVSLDNAENGEYFVTDDLCAILREIPEFEGDWFIAILIVPSAVPEFHTLDDLVTYLQNGGLYYFGSYSVNVDCQVNQGNWFLPFFQ